MLPFLFEAGLYMSSLKPGFSILGLQDRLILPRLCPVASSVEAWSLRFLIDPPKGVPFEACAVSVGLRYNQVRLVTSLDRNMIPLRELYFPCCFRER